MYSNWKSLQDIDFLKSFIGPLAWDFVTEKSFERFVSSDIPF